MEKWILRYFDYQERRYISSLKMHLLSTSRSNFFFKIMASYSLAID